MATVQSMTLPRLLALEADTVVGGHIDGSGNLILEQHDGSTIDAGSALAAIPDASETVKGKVELATSAETITGTDAVRAVTPAGLQAKVASDTAKGIVELATNAEATTGTDNTRALTPANLPVAVTTHVAAASTTVSGKVELATSAETITGTDAVRAVTPQGLAAAVALSGKGVLGCQYTNTNTTVASTTSPEVAVPAASWAVEPTYTFVNGRLYKLTICYGPNNDSGSSSWMIMQVRKGSASTTGTILNKHYYHYPAGFGGLGASVQTVAYVKNNSGSNVATKLSMTMANSGAVGNARFWTGSPAGGDALSILVEDIGGVADFADLANLAVQI